MPYSVPLSARLKADGWKAKIRDRERLEPPHVTILHKTRAWRLGLRDFQFLDTEPDPSDVPHEVVGEVLAHLTALRAAWDEMYPENPVSGEVPDAR
jgi:hypothetical protein